MTHMPVLGDASSCRKLWAAVLLAVLNDAWRDTAKSKGDPHKIARVRADALRYFRSRDGREVAMLAGITAAPERMADMAVDLTARERTSRDYETGISGDRGQE